MASLVEDDDWSDSEEDQALDSSELETSVQLGIPDGPIDTTVANEDVLDAAVSRIGGLPVRVIAPFRSCVTPNRY